MSKIHPIGWIWPMDPIIWPPVLPWVSGFIHVTRSACLTDSAHRARGVDSHCMQHLCGVCLGCVLYAAASGPPIACGPCPRSGRVGAACSVGPRLTGAGAKRAQSSMTWHGSDLASGPAQCYSPGLRAR